MKNIANNLPQTDKTTLTEIMNRIINLVMVEQIYTTHRNYGTNDNRIEFIILISDKCINTLASLFPIMNVVFKDYPRYCYRLYHAHQVKDSLKHGNLFFYTACTLKNQLYTDPSSGYKLLPEAIEFDEILLKAKQGFDKEIAKIKAFNQGAVFYLEKQDHALAAFMVHQQIELAYRSIEIFAMGKNKVSHSIRLHQKHVAPYLHNLGMLFNEANEAENLLMQQLDDAYIAVRYKNSYQIDKGNLLIAMEKATLAQEIVCSTHNELLNNLIQQCLPEDALSAQASTLKVGTIIHPNKLKPDSIIGKIITSITDQVNVQHIYCFGKREIYFTANSSFLSKTNACMYIHYDLLVITAHETENPAQLQCKVNNIPDFKNKATVVMHSAASIQEMLNNNNHFFYTVLKYADLVYTSPFQNENTGLNIKLPNAPIHQKDLYLKQSLYWKQRINRTKAFYEAACSLWVNEGNEQVVVSLLAQSIQQVCLGAIYVFLGYSPKQHELLYLLNLCCNFTDKFELMLLHQDKLIFKILNESTIDIKYKGAYEVSPTDVSLLHRYCTQFIEQIEKLCETQLEILKSNTNL